MKVIAEIDDPILARKLLEHLGLPADELELAPARGPPEDEPDEPDEPPPEPPPVTEDEDVAGVRERRGSGGTSPGRRGTATDGPIGRDTLVGEEREGARPTRNPQMSTQLRNVGLSAI